MGIQEESVVRAVDIIAHTRDGVELSPAEIEALVHGFARGEVPDYQVSAWLMAAVLRGLTPRETAALTTAIVSSGKTLSWPASLGVVADKHSTGGVGDKTSLVVVPLAAAAGVPVAKMSGRGLGHTGGTLDKLESIPGFSVNLTVRQFQSQVERLGLAIVAQSPDLAPADGKLYALRDVTGTVESLPLIASSIMSKKIAAGAHVVVLDVKTGAGAFMRNPADARALSEAMVSLGRAAGRGVCAVISAMNEPLGRAVGNALEVQEAAATLRGEGPADLTSLGLELGAHMLVLAGVAAGEADARARMRRALQSGEALERLRQMVRAQGGDSRCLDEPGRLPVAPVVRTVVAETSGYVLGLDARVIGEAVMQLGGGRAKKGDAVDHAVGIVFSAKVGARVNQGEPLFEVHARAADAAEQAASAVKRAYTFSEKEPTTGPLVLEVMS
jgi:pyrimidine-nucleoside phosphorylase